MISPMRFDLVIDTLVELCLHLVHVLLIVQLTTANIHRPINTKKLFDHGVLFLDLLLAVTHTIYYNNQ